jgi:Helix-turn-helix domain
MNDDDRNRKPLLGHGIADRAAAGMKRLNGSPDISPVEDRYLDLHQLALYSSLSVRTLRDYLSAPHDPIPSYCVRRKILVRRSEFDRWLEKYRVDATRVSRLVDDILCEMAP